MASSLERLILGLSGQPVAKGQQITPEQRMQSAAGLLAAGRSLMDAAESGQSRGSALLGAIQDAGGGASEFAQRQMQLEAQMLEAEQKRRAYDAQTTAPKLNDYDNQSDWLRATGNHFLRYGFSKKASEFFQQLPLGTPNEESKFIVAQRKEHKKQREAYREAYDNFEQINQLLLLGKGQSDFAALMKTIKSLDDSVVRPSEKEAFDQAAGVVNVIESNLNKLKDGKLPLETVKNIYDMAFTAFEIYQRGYLAQIKEEASFYDTQFQTPGLGMRILQPPEIAPIKRLTLEELRAGRNKDLDDLLEGF